MIHNEISIQAEIDRDIKHALDTMPLSRHTSRRQAGNRRVAIGMLRRAVATVIADDLADDVTPLERTINKYALLREMDDNA